MNKASFTFPVDESLMNEFTAAARSRDRNGAELLREFMQEYVQQQQAGAEDETWFRQQVKTGLDQANAGQLIPGAEVEANFTARRAETRRKISKDD
jgi:predicted transcriptional regulator